jgi:hypothetical protein
MATKRGMVSLAAGLMLGLLAGWLLFGQGPVLQAAGNSDRNGDYVICTGPIVQNFTNTNFGFELDGVWLLDYRTGKLMASAVNRLDGKMQAWTEVDLVKEFGIAPRATAHFVMTTGLIAKGQAALYLAETTTGKMGVYTMALTDETVQAGLNAAIGANMTIRRHDLTSFRGAARPAEPKPAAPAR